MKVDFGRGDIAAEEEEEDDDDAAAAAAALLLLLCEGEAGKEANFSCMSCTNRSCSMPAPLSKDVEP